MVNFLSAVALFHLGMGVVGLVAPEFVVGLFGTKSLDANGRSEVRAVYGGFGVAIAAWLTVAGRVRYQNPAFAAGALGTTAVGLLGMAAGRMVSLLVDRRVGAFPALFCVVEIGLASMLAVDAGDSL